MDVNLPPAALRAYVPPLPPPSTRREEAPAPAIQPEDYVHPGTPQGERAVDPEELWPKMEHIQEILKQMGYQLEYGLYEGTEEFYATVTDPRTREVVKRIPSEEILELHRRLLDLTGNLIDERA